MRRLTDAEMSGSLIRAGRALAGVSAEELAVRATLGIATVKRAEAEGGLARMTPANRKALLIACDQLGLEFVGSDDGSRGVVLRALPLCG